MTTPEELMSMIAGTLRISQEINAANAALQSQQARAAGNAEAHGVLRDDRGYSQKELDKIAMDFVKSCPTFERGKDRWVDFARQFTLHKKRYQVNDEVAKEALWLAIKGRSSRIVIASMCPDNAEY